MCQVLSGTLAKALVSKTPRLLTIPRIQEDHLGGKAGSQGRGEVLPGWVKASRTHQQELWRPGLKLTSAMALMAL